MKAKKGRGTGLLLNNSGFTLIEMAIVLIIIGIIIGAVVKGKDLVRSAEQKKIYSKFLNERRTAYLNFYDRTGKILGDTYDGAAAGQDGKADTSAGTGLTPTDPGRAALYDGPATGTAYRGLSQVGLTAPVTNTDNNWQYRYTDSCGGAHDVTIAFANDTTDNYNFMEITYIPTELAMALDTMIDGEADGQNGDFLHGDGTNDWGTSPCAIAANRARWKMDF